MFPIWFDEEPWKLIVAGSGPSSSLFAKFRANHSEKLYDFYLTDFATIWHEFGDQTLIKSNLKPYENFIDVSDFDVFGVLTNMLADEKVQVNINPDMTRDGISVETRAQIGFIKFSWTFKMNVMDFRESSMYFKRTLIVPALHLLSILKSSGSTGSFNIETDKSAIQKEEWTSFEELKAKLVYQKDAPTFMEEHPSRETAAVNELPSIEETIVEKQAPLPAPTEIPAVVEPEKTVDPEFERRQKLQAMLKQQAEADKKKKRKLI